MLLSLCALLATTTWKLRDNIKSGQKLDAGQWSFATPVILPFYSSPPGTVGLGMTRVGVLV